MSDAQAGHGQAADRVWARGGQGITAQVSAVCGDWNLKIFKIFKL